MANRAHRIESPDSVGTIRPRMFEAYGQLRRLHKLPVLPIGVFLRVGLDGICIDVYEENFLGIPAGAIQVSLRGIARPGRGRICQG